MPFTFFFPPFLPSPGDDKVTMQSGIVQMQRFFSKNSKKPTLVDKRG